MAGTDSLDFDVVVFGGGGAGLWLLDALHRRGLSVCLLEAAQLGSGQTIASQGIIHGGLKYTLGDLFAPSAKAIKAMPNRWRDCLAGSGRPNLDRTRLRARFCYLWRTGSISSRLAMAGAKTFLDVRPQPVERDQWPAALAHCPQVLRLDEQVIDPGSFIRNLAEQHGDRLFKIDDPAGLAFEVTGARGGGHVTAVRITHPRDRREVRLCPKFVVFAAGRGNAALRQRVGLSAEVMQCRPLHMVMLRGTLPVLNGHCVDGATTRVTITTDTDPASGSSVWQVGGQVAEDGVKMDRAELVAHAHSELEASLPGIDLSGAQFASFRVERA
ncbi:MAG: FAD-dependent oxidoreductase [Phycisphaeraceae bacterium]